jgi:hypothetical protein
VATSLAVLCSLSEDELLEEAFRIPNDIYKIIGQIHNTLEGHFGVELTLKRVQDINSNLPNLRSYVRKFIQHCPCCQKMSYLNIPIHTSPFTSTYNIMQINSKVHDSIGVSSAQLILMQDTAVAVAQKLQLRLNAEHLQNVSSPNLTVSL